MNATIRSARPSQGRCGKQLEILEYGSLAELNSLLEQTDAHSHANGLRVVIVLDATFCGHLASLVQRRCRGFRLVVTTAAERIAGAAEAYQHEGTSWQEMVIEQGVEQSIRREIAQCRLSDRLLIFWPNWQMG